MPRLVFLFLERSSDPGQINSSILCLWSLTCWAPADPLLRQQKPAADCGPFSCVSCFLRAHTPAHPGLLCSSLCTMERQHGQGLQMLRTTLPFSSCKRLDSFSPSPALKLTGAVRTQHSSTRQHLGWSCTQTRSRTISALFLFSLWSAAPFLEPLGLPNSSVPQSHPGPPRAGTQPRSEQQGPVSPPASRTSAPHKLLCTNSMSRMRPRVQVYDRPRGAAGPKPTGSSFAAWHELSTMPQSLQDQGTSQGASCWTWEKAAESRNGKTKPCCGPANTDTWDSHLLLLFLLLLFFPPASAAPWGSEWCRWERAAGAAAPRPSADQVPYRSNQSRFWPDPLCNAKP